MYFEKSSRKLLLVNNPQIHPVPIMADVWPPEISIFYGLWIEPFLNETPTKLLLKLCMKLYFSLKLLSVLSKQST